VEGVLPVAGRGELVQPRNAKVAKSLTNVDVVVLALAQLGGATKKVHSERIAARAFELTPERFSWRLPEFRERQWPDKDLVRVSLVHAKSAEYGRLVKGTYHTDLSKDGWTLTAAGSEWIVANENRIRDGLAGSFATIPRQEAERFCRQLKSDPLFKKFTKSGTLDAASQYDFTDLLLCSPDAPQDTIKLKYERLLSTAHVVKDRQILTFLEACKSRFAGVLGNKEDTGRGQQSK
jgi:hypothetical protein